MVRTTPLDHDRHRHATATATATATVNVTAIDKKPGPLLAELSRSIARSIFRVRVCVSTPTPINTSVS